MEGVVVVLEALDDGAVVLRWSSRLVVATMRTCAW
jgi:hypothetical protein